MMETPEPEPFVAAEPARDDVEPATTGESEAGESEASESEERVDADDALAQLKERGFITTGEIFAAFPDLEPDADELKNLWEMYESAGIKVLDEIAEELQLEDQR